MQYLEVNYILEFPLNELSLLITMVIHNILRLVLNSFRTFLNGILLGELCKMKINSHTKH